MIIIDKQVARCFIVFHAGTTFVVDSESNRGRYLSCHSIHLAFLMRLYKFKNLHFVVWIVVEDV